MSVPELEALYDTVARCNRCGFCQAGCPVYRVTGLEHSLARGRLALVRSVIEGRMPLSDEVKAALDDCLLCRGCTAHCFPALRTDEIVTTLRQAYLTRHGQPALQRLLFRTILPDNQLLEQAGRWMLWGRRSGLAGLTERAGILGLLDSRLPVANQVVGEAPADTFRQRAAARRAPLLRVKCRVGYFVSCGFNFLYPDVAEASVAVLARAGCAVAILDNTCCGRPAHAYGDVEAAKHIARRNVDRLGPALDFDAIVSDCGSCSSFLKEYGSLLADDLAYARPAAALAARVRSFSQLLASMGLPPAAREVAARVTYHDPCHLSGRFSSVTAQPRALLKAIPGVAYAELPEADWCCGAAGSYTFLHHDRASGVLERKMRNVQRTQAAIVATECPACMTHLAYGARRYELPVHVRHVSQLLAEAYVDGRRGHASA